MTTKSNASDVPAPHESHEFVAMLGDSDVRCQRCAIRWTDSRAAKPCFSQGN